MNKPNSADESTQASTQMARQTQPTNQDLLRIFVCGSTNDGKDTLVSRLLQSALPLADDQSDTHPSDSEKYNALAQSVGFTFLTGEPTAELQRNATNGVTYRCFSSKQRKYVVADMSGHERNTQRMLTEASMADVALMVVDARKGLSSQTRHHAHLLSLMGIRYAVLAVNDMDQLGFDAKVFADIAEAFARFTTPLGWVDISAIPLSIRQGDNITQGSCNTPWYSGPSLLAYLESVQAQLVPRNALIFPARRINQPDTVSRECIGTVVQGCVQLGDQMRVTASGQTAKVVEMATKEGSLTQAMAGDVVMFRWDGVMDVSHNDVLSLAQQALDMSDQFEATLVWMAEEAGHAGRSYDIKLANQQTTVSITHIKHRVDVTTLAPEASTQLKLNEVSLCNLATSKPLVFDAYQNSKALGGFVLVDKFSHATLAIGMIKHSLRRAQNVHRQALSITRLEREQLNGHRGKVIWFTGLSGSGKSTLANALEIALHAQGKRTYVLDGDNVRQGLNKDLGFTDADRVENIRRVAEVAKLMMDAGMIVMTAFISPFRQEREMARALIGPENFIEVYVSTPLEVCEQRDVKGLYKKARNGQLPNMSGISSPYEPPLEPQVTLGSHLSSIEDSIEHIARILNR